MTLTPLGQNILGRLVEEEQKTASGIVLPDSASKSDLVMLTVVAVGKDVVQVRLGQTILVRRTFIDEIKLDGLGTPSEKFFTVPEDDVTGFVPQETAS